MSLPLSKSDWYSLGALLTTAFFCGGAWYLVYLYAQMFDAGLTSFSLHWPGRCMQYFIWWGAGLAGCLFMCAADSDSLSLRACVWGVVQGISTWVLAYPAAFLGCMNDGFGICLILFAPFATLPSFVVALLLAMAEKGKRPQFYTRARFLCLMVLLVFISVTAMSAILSV